MRGKKKTNVPSEASDNTVRADRWLWAARFYKSRSLAGEVCNGGKVEVNGHKAKPHKLVRVNDTVEFMHPHGTKKLRVLAVSEKRGPAAEARLLYEDNSPPPPPREERVDFFQQPSSRLQGQGRPTKRQRRETEWLRGR